MTHKIPQEVSCKITNMGAICAILVVFIHLPRIFGGMGEHVLWGYFAHGIGKVAVPFFFAAAGYFLAGHFDEDGWYGREVKKRMFSLLIPLMLWCVIWFGWGKIVIPLVAHFIEHGESFNFPSIKVGELAQVLAIHPFKQPYLCVLWFVRVLFLMVLAAPLLRHLANPIAVLSLWLLNGLTFPDYGVKCTPVVFTFAEGACSFFAMAWFCFGMMVRLRQIDVLLNKRVGVVCGLIGFALLAYRGLPYTAHKARILTWASIPFLMAFVWSLCPTCKCPAWLSKSSFPIYLLHMFVIVVVEVAIKHLGSIHTDSACLGAIGYLCFGVVVVAFSIAMSVFMRKCCPRLASVLFGGR